MQPNEDAHRFVLRTLCKKIPVILSIFRSNSVQAWPLWWNYTNTYIGAPSDFLQWEEVNTTNKVAWTLPTAQCIHNDFMSYFICILILFYVPLNSGNTLKHAINLLLSSWKFTYRSCFWALNSHLHSCKLLKSMEEEYFPRISKGKHRPHEEVKSMLMRCRWPAYGFIKPPSQPAPLENSSALPKLLLSNCASLEEIKGPESWPIAGFSALLSLITHPWTLLCSQQS